MHKERRDRHLQKLDREQHHEELEGRKASDKARERFRRPPYQITDVAGYMAVDQHIIICHFQRNK